MSVVVPRYLKGNNVSLFTVKNPSSIASDGTLTIPVDANSNNLHYLGVFDSFEYNGTLRSEEISAADALVENYAPIKDTFEITVSEIVKADGTSVLMSDWGSATYFRVAAKVTLDGAVPANTDNAFVGIFIRDTCRMNIVEGKSVVQLTGKPCGIVPYYGPYNASTI